MAEENYPYGDKYKFKDLKTYGSSEWMFGSTKRYRQVFDKSELDYVGAELSFYNKLFDEKDWKANVRLKAIKMPRGKKICDLNEEMTISKDDNIITFYKSWGSKEVGSFWEEGIYEWEAYIDNALVGSVQFYVEDVGKVTNINNPFFDVVSMRLYNGKKDGKNLHGDKFFKKFKRDETYYIWTELKIRPKVKKDFKLEFDINYKDDAGQLKGRMHRLYDIDKKNKGKIVAYEEGWGNNSGNSFMDDKYYVELLFMDTVVAMISFDVGDEFVEGETPLLKGSDALMSQTMDASEAEKEESLEDVMAELESLIGLNEVKRNIKEHIQYLEFIKVRQEKGFDDTEKVKLNSVFTGNPGTGKTTVVKLLGKIYKHMGLLENGMVHEVDRADLVGQYIGQTAPRVKKALDDAHGGILFVDEAYALVRQREDTKDYGLEVIEILLKEMSDGDGKTAVMFAGYPKEMQTFLDFNPGLRSRINHYFHFDDYLPEELLRISEYAAEKRSVSFTDEAKELVEKILIDAYRDRDESFGNARYAYSIVDEGKMNMGLRLMQVKDLDKLSKEELETIEKEDVAKIVAKSQKTELELPVDEQLLHDSLEELKQLIGLTDIKTEMGDLVKLVKYYRETGKDVMNKFSLHTVFTGNPGTGKTTVARLIGKIFKALGMLERGHLVEVDREGLIAGYVGQTAIKTKEAIDEAMGGVLFIDEAYALIQGYENDFGHEAIEVILKNMEDRRGQFAVITAGYPVPMKEFLKSNPGLKSRFDRTLHFPDFHVDELKQITDLMMGKEGLKMDEAATEYVVEHISKLYKARDQYFGNAREMRRMVGSIVKKQNLRMAEVPADKRTPEMIATVVLEDVNHLVIKLDEERKSVGFR